MNEWIHRTTTIPYEVLWRASQSALRMAEIEDKGIRPDHLSISSVLTGFMAFEGFLNFVGETIASEAWSNERGYFSGPKYGGIIGKVGYLFSKFPEKNLEKGEEPYQTFKKLRDTRDEIAHNRTKTIEEVSKSEFPSFDEGMPWDDFDTPKKVEPSLDMLKQFAEIIRIEAVKLLAEEDTPSNLMYAAFEGSIAHSEGERVD